MKKTAKVLGSVVMMVSSSAIADDLTDRFTFAGFGYQDFRQTSANRVDYVDSGGNWDHNFLGLIMAAQVSDKSKIWAQLQADSTEQTRFTWLFADYQFTSTLTGHAGRVKFPFGLINEYIDNKALQLSLNLPMAYSESADMTYDAYTGVGLDWNEEGGSLGNLLVQGYAGNTYNYPNSSLAKSGRPRMTPRWEVERMEPPSTSRLMICVRFSIGRMFMSTP